MCFRCARARSWRRGQVGQRRAARRLHHRRRLQSVVRAGPHPPRAAQPAAPGRVPLGAVRHDRGAGRPRGLGHSRQPGPGRIRPRAGVGGAHRPSTACPDRSRSVSIRPFRRCWCCAPPASGSPVRPAPHPRARRPRRFRRFRRLGHERARSMSTVPAAARGAGRRRWRTRWSRRPRWTAARPA